MSRLKILILLLALPLSALAESTARQKVSISAHLDAWDVRSAANELAPLAASHPEDPDVTYLKARLAFLQHKYSDAVTHMESLADGSSDQRLHGALALYRRTRDVSAQFKTHQTSGGHFIIAYPPNADEVLIPYADIALEQAYERLGEIFRYRPQDPIRVEIYPHVKTLADVSPLKASEIRASGTIALCKYNRLMIVSPRALVYGYEWLDTLAHEYIHLLVTRRSRGTVPIWLHEGMAKFFENRWRETANARLSPISEDLLAKALKAKKLIRFEAMSPSMAKLPTQEDTALAFAEVFMVMELMYEKGGVDALNQLLDLMRSGKKDREAVEKVAQKSFSRFQREWKMYLWQRNLSRLPTHARSELLFRDKAKPRDELKGIPEDKARDLAYLGDRLAARKRYKAASKEYDKALGLLGGPNPLISAKLASALTKQGLHRRVIKVVDPAVELNPSHVLLYLYRGKALLAIGDYEAARRDLTRAVHINPFDPEVHGLLARALTHLGQSKEAAIEQRLQRLVTTE